MSAAVDDQGVAYVWGEHEVLSHPERPDQGKHIPLRINWINQRVQVCYATTVTSRHLAPPPHPTGCSEFGISASEVSLKPHQGQRTGSGNTRLTRRVGRVVSRRRCRWGATT